MSKLGQGLIKGLEDALKYERGEIQLRTTTLSKANGTNAREANPTGGMLRDATSVIGAGETMGKDEKQRLDVEADGKRELDYGKEDLEKEPKKKTKLAARWEEIKKGLDNQSAIIDLDSLSEDESEQPENDPGDASAQPNPDDDADGGAVPDDQEEDSDDSHPEWVPEGVEHDSSEEEAPEQEDEGEEPQAEEQPEEQEEGGGEEGDPEAEAEIEEALKAMGHSDAEIAHIIHGHMVPQVDEVKRVKAAHEHMKADHDAEEHQKEMAIRDEEAKIEAEHAKRMKDVEYQRAQKEAGETDLELEHKKRLQDLEFEKEKAAASFNEAKVEAEHKKRMLDLEYENAKAQKALELQFKEKEHAMKLKHAEQLAQEKHKAALDMAKEDAAARKAEKKMDLQQRAVDKKEDLKISAKQKEEDRKLKAKETAQDRAKASSKMKKSEDESDDLVKASMAGWKFNPATQQMNHSTLGSIGAIKDPSSGGFHVKHNGEHVASVASAGEAGLAIKNHIRKLGQVNVANPDMNKEEDSVKGPPPPPIKKVPATKTTYSPAAERLKEKITKRPYVDIPDKPIKKSATDAEASRGEEWRSQQDDEEPHRKEPADEDSKGEKSNIADDEKRDSVMQLGVSSVNSHNKSKYHGNKA